MTYCDPSIFAPYCENALCSKCGYQKNIQNNFVTSTFPQPPKQEECNCKEMTCPKDCTSKHTHKGFFCEKCEPEAYKQIKPPKQGEECSETKKHYCHLENCPNDIDYREEKESWDEDWKKDYAIKRAIPSNSVAQIDEEIQFISALLHSQAIQIEEAIEGVESKLMRSSPDSTDEIFLKDGSPVPKGNNTEDSYYNLGILHALSHVKEIVGRFTSKQ